MIGNRGVHFTQSLASDTALRLTGRLYVLAVEDVGTSEGNRLVSVCHYAVRNGDLMRDPDMVFEIHQGPDFLAAEPLSVRNDYMGLMTVASASIHDSARAMPTAVMSEGTTKSIPVRLATTRIIVVILQSPFRYGAGCYPGSSSEGAVLAGALRRFSCCFKG